MASWAPQPDGLAELLQLLRDSLSPNTAEQQAVTARLESFNSVPDYVNYLVYVLGALPHEDERTRSIAGLILKNQIRYHYEHLSADNVEYVKHVVLPALSDANTMVRNTASGVVAMLVVIIGPENWPEALQKLVQILDSPNEFEVEGAFSTWAKICEDIPTELEVDINGVRPLDIMIPKFLQFLSYPNNRVRVHALNCLNQFIPTGSSSLQAHIDAFIAELFKRASDESSDVRRFVCQALVLLLGSRPDKLVPEMGNVVEYMLYSTQDKDEDVALEACEFWLSFAEQPQLHDHLQPYLPKVAPVLLKGMVYSEADIAILENDVDDDAAVPDKESDIRPVHYRGKTHANARMEETGTNGSDGQSKDRFGAEQKDEDEDDDDFDLDDDDEEFTDWNLRKCSAAALDVIAVNYGNELLEILLPYLKEKLFSEDWLQRESGILALGAIADGCLSGVEPHLRTLVPYLINALNDTRPPIRSIACWTLGRYSGWCVNEDATPEHKAKYFVPAMEALLRMVLDNNKRVQEAGCSAFATLEEAADHDLDPFLEPIIRNLVFAFNKYQQKNLLILYDAIGTLADHVGSALNNPELLELLLPPLIHKWQNLSDEDTDLIPLLECLSSVTIAIGPGFYQFAGPVFERCLKIVHTSLLSYRQEDPNNLDEVPDRTFIIVALDLLSGMTQGLKGNVRQYVEQTQPALLPMMPLCINHPEPAVRQSAYALLGDLAISCFDLLRPYLAQIMPELIRQIDVDPKVENVSVCNNAAWAAGEIALQYGSDPEIQQWVPPLIDRLVPVLLSPKSVKSLSENAAVTIGRLGLVCPNLVAPHLEAFVQAWCQALWDIRDNEEKDSAFRGLCLMIQQNPNGLAKSFVYFCNAVVRWSTPSEELNDMFTKIIRGFREMSGPQWEVQTAQFPPVIMERLHERYGV